METAELCEQSSGIIYLPRVWVQTCVWYVLYARDFCADMLDVVPFEYLGVGVGMGCIYLLDLSKK